MARKLTKTYQREVVPKKAEELAKSGEFSGWYAIEVHLRSEGYTEARWILDDERIRENLDRLCQEAHEV